MELALTGTPRVIAHRGASARAPENTVAAAMLAVRMGADAVECDVHRTSDGQLVVVHDATLDRTTDARTVLSRRRSWRVRDLTADQVARVDAGSWFAPSYAGERVPTLAEWATAVGSAGMVVEVKKPHLYPGIARDLAWAVRAEPALRQAAADGRLLVQCFADTWLAELRAELPFLPLAWLADRTPRPEQVAAVAEHVDGVNPGRGAVTPDLVDALHARGLTAEVWTANRRRHFRRALAAGVDGIITNHPDKLLRVLGRETALAA